MTFGQLAVQNSTFTDNTAPLNGAAINVQGTGTLALVNSTLYNNRSGSSGGAVANLGTTTISDSTFAGNHASRGAGIFNSYSVTFNNNIFADNATVLPTSVNSTSAVAGPPFFGSNNVFYNNTAAGVVDDRDGYATTNFIAANAEPLAAIANNGGLTRTMAPTVDSAAICAGSLTFLPTGLDKDQRGLARTDGSCLDVGSVQISQPVAKRTTTTSLTVSANSVGTGTIVNLVATVLGDAPTGTVNFVDNGLPLSCSPALLVVGTTSSTATCATTFTSAGTHSITAIYSGDATFAQSTSSIAAIAVSLPVEPTPMLSPWMMLLLGGIVGAVVFLRLDRTNYCSFEAPQAAKK